ncbi:MAG: response regulator [Salinimicrobium sp.]
MKKTILLIEDDETLSKNLAELLEISNYTVLMAKNGRIGVEIARNELPDLIISDIMMPELDGYGVYEILRRNKDTRTIPFIFMSVKSEPGDVRKGMNMGADDYLTKPFEEQDLLEVISNRLAKRAMFSTKDKKVSHRSVIHDLESLQEYFRREGESVSIEKNEEVFQEGRIAGSVYLLETGMIKTFRLDEYGKELITEVHKNGNILGFYGFKSSIRYPESAQALEKTEAFRITSEDFIQKLLLSQDLTVEFAQILSDDLSILKTHLLEMAYGSVLKKTTNTILQFAEEIQGDPQQYIRISRSDLASVAGISTESFIRSLSCLKKEGLIDIVGRNIKILDLQKLHEIR